MVRRLKEDIRAIQEGFPKRIVERVEIDNLPSDAPEIRLSELLDQYRTIREERHATTSQKAQAAAGLLIVGLQQRLMSSIEAFARTLQVHRRTVVRQWERRQEAAAEIAVSEEEEEISLLQAAPDADDERGEWEEDQLEEEEATEVEKMTVAAEAGGVLDARTEELWRREQELLDRMEKIAEEHRHLPDAKVRRLIEWIRENLCPGLPIFGERAPSELAQWNNRRVLIFTENREGTKRYLRTILEQAIAGTDCADERIEVIDGLTSSRRRREIQRRFKHRSSQGPTTNPAGDGCGAGGTELPGVLHGSVPL